MTLRVRFQLGRPHEVECPPPIFGSVQIGGPRAGSLGASVLVHGLMVLLVIFVSHHLASQDERVDWSRYDLEMIRLRIEEPLYFRAAKTGSTPKPQPAPAAKPAGRPVEAAASQPAAPEPPQPGPAVPRRLMLPPPQQAARNAPIFIQPDLNPQLAPPKELPPMAFWARRVPDPPRPKPPSQEVVPGRTEAPAAAPKLAATPSVAVPNRERTVAEINVSLPPMPPTPAALPLPNSSTMPIRLRDAKESEAASFDQTAGQPVNVIALAAERNDIRNVAIPKGLQNIPSTSASDGPARAAGDGRNPAPAPATASQDGKKAQPDQNPNAPPPAQSATAAGNRTPGTSTNASANGSATAPTPSANTPANAPTASAGGPPKAPAADSPANASTPVRASANAAAEAPTPAAPGAGAPPRGAGAPNVTRIEHPSNGNFDVVLMQSATRDDLLIPSGTLSGSPVYSVYLRVGDQKEWLLEYCAPAAQNVQANPYQINVEDASAITPPYPISTVIPNSMLGQAIPKHIVLHGFLSATGSLRGVKGLDAASPLLAEILAVLSQWQFRPALRNKKPIDVEILLVIPGRG